MAGTAAHVRPFGLIHKCSRSTYRTPTDSGYEAFSSIVCGCVRIIDLEVQLNDSYDGNIWILVFDTTETDPSRLTLDSVPYLPPKLVTPGDAARAMPKTEWIPFNIGILICASTAETLEINGLVGTDIISTYCRYEVVAGGC